MRLTVQEIIKACNGTLKGVADSGAVDSGIMDIVISSVSTDSRSVAPGALFVPLVGPAFDGHDYIESAVASGAVIALTEKDIIAPVPLIRVASTSRALMDLAAYYRSLFKVKVVAVTGSAGKTTTKDMVGSVLAQKYRTLKTKGNLNNTIGLPLTVFQLEPWHEVMVLEMGMNHFGEIHDLSMTAKPDLSVITNIGDAHIENLGSRQGILQAKLEIRDGMNKPGVLVVNGDDPLLGTALLEGVERGKVIICKLNNAYDGMPKQTGPVITASALESRGLQGTSCVIEINGSRQPLHVPQAGTHMVMNALLAAAVGNELGLSLEEIARGIEMFKPSGNRMACVNANDMIILNDTYNANPASVRAAVDVLAGQDKQNGRQVCIIGDMLELGEQAEGMHHDLGLYIAERGIDLLVAVGQLARSVYEGYQQYKGIGTALHFENKNAFMSQWQSVLQPKDSVLVKASHSMQFEKIVDALTEPASINA